MGLLTRTVAGATLSLALTAGCTLHDRTTYPLALPAQTPARWANTPLIPTTPPPPELAYQAPVRKTASLVPTEAEWSLWEPAPSQTTVCRGRGKARRCTETVSPAVAQAQAPALIRPPRRHLGNGASAMITYAYQPGAIYLVEVAPHAGTHLLLPDGERLRLPPVLNKAMFVVGTDDSPEEATRNDLIALRATQAPQRAVHVPLIFRSGLIITVRLVTVAGDPMSLVQWQVPPVVAKVQEVPLTSRPPKFDTTRSYTGYTLTVEGKDKLAPPWMPVAVADDGSNTLIQFTRALDWTRSPVVVGIAQNGKPNITPSRYWHRPDAPDAGAWLFVQGRWPALLLKDSAGLRVKIVRQPPSNAGGPRHAAR
jgi:type IV secretory pathway VirB9-like protein